MENDTLYLVKQVRADEDWWDEPVWALIPWTPQMRECLRRIRDEVLPLCDPNRDPAVLAVQYRDWSPLLYCYLDLPLLADAGESREFVSTLHDYDRTWGIYDGFLTGLPPQEVLAERSMDADFICLEADQYGFYWPISQEGGSHPMGGEVHITNWAFLDTWGEAPVMTPARLREVLAEDMAAEEALRIEAQRIIDRDQEEHDAQ